MNNPIPPAIPPLTPENYKSLRTTTPGMAVAALVLGIVSLLGTAILIVPTVLAIVFGHISYSRIRRDSKLKGEGLAIAGLVLGYLSIPATVFLGILAAMAIPAFEKVRDESLRKAMQNDARQIAAASQQVMLENGEKPVHFHIDPITGTLTGPLSAYVSRVTKGTEEVDGTIENAHDSFSLRNQRLFHGKEFTFDADGKPE